MLKRFVLTIGVLLLACAYCTPAIAQSSPLYDLYLNLGKKALQYKDFDNAIIYFQEAQVAYPEDEEALEYINLIKRASENRVTETPFKESLDLLPPRKEFTPLPRPVIAVIEDSYSSPTSKRPLVPPVTQSMTASPKQIIPPTPDKPLINLGKRIISPQIPKVLTKPEIIYMDDSLWARQPNTTIKTELKSTLIFEGKNIERFLIITPGYVAAEIVGRDQFKVTALKRGSTLVHVWDDRGRWTFNIDIIMPIPKSPVAVDELNEEHARPFRATYIADWNSFYRGNRFQNVERENLDFLQRVLVNGETPYGDLDGFVLFSKFDLSTEVTGYGYGISDGHIGNFKDFSVRGGDTQIQFSPLTLSGQTVRGASFKAEAFDNKLEYSYIRGKDRSIVGFLSAGILDTKESYVEGGRIRLFPHGDHQYALNWARGFGTARQSFLKDQVYSLETKQKIKGVNIDSELAYDEDTIGFTLNSDWKKGNGNYFVNLRHIGSDFATITTLPGNRGEVGGLLGANYRWGRTNFDTTVDIYRERFQNNPDDPDAINFDFRSALNLFIDNTQNIKSVLAYTDTPGELSPRKNLRFNSSYSKRFKYWSGRDISTFLGSTYQRSRFKFSPASEYDRYALTFGANLELIKSLSYYFNYEYSWVDEIQANQVLEPRVLNTGFNYARKITDDWFGNASITYRDEENTEGNNSYLAGEDSVTMSIGATFRPSENFEFYVDGRARNVWAEENSRAAFNEVDIRAGVRTSWDAPFSWDPKGKVGGIVYKDLNSNQHRDPSEIGIGGVTVIVGEKKVVTDQRGEFTTSIRAKRVQARVDLATIPDGFIFTTPVATSVAIIPHKKQMVEFGLSTRSSIYGLVYLDKNGNGKPDPDDEFVPRVVLSLDGEKLESSDFEGAYTFKEISPGTHTVHIDINSLPIEYLPLLKLKNVVNVEEGTTFVLHIPVKKKDTK